MWKKKRKLFRKCIKKVEKTQSSSSIPHLQLPLTLPILRGVWQLSGSLGLLERSHLK
jgi:hypothetical protein